jgi:hypothetical protein
MPNQPQSPPLAPDLSKPAFVYRFDIYVPVVDNNGYLIEPYKFRRVRKQIMEAFGGVTFAYPYGGAGVDGMYIGVGATYHDKNAIFTVLGIQDESSVQFFISHKPKWQKLFEQEVLLVTLQQMQTF